MRRIATIILSLAFVLSSFQASAIVANRKTVDYHQPDGSTIKIQLHGDEFHHWATTPDGKVLELDANNFLKPSNKGVPVASANARFNRQKAEEIHKSAMGLNSLTMGEHRFLIILVEFSDLHFGVNEPQQAFWNLLNEPGYSKNGGTGSAFDYFNENSSDLFQPSFDVYGPVELSGKYADYGGNDMWGNDKNPDGGFYEACQLIDDQVDFSIYDQDGDGTVDNIFFYYAGHNEAEGGSANTIWPHAYAFYYYGGRFDGVKLGSYACTSEYRGSYGSTMCGIGTFCHEFGHVLGLPDFYDTDYNSNGYCDPLGSFSLMDSGSYNNNGCTPPYMSAIERNLLGWMDEPTEITSDGYHTLAPIHECQAYITPTENQGEYFLMETRDGTGWDKYIASGMIIYHVDQSNNVVHGTTAKNRWSSWNGINCYSDHPCYYIKKAKDSYSEGYFPFPGYGNVRVFRGKSWAGVDNDFTLNNITYSNHNTTFIVSSNQVKMIAGSVKDTFGYPIKGAEVNVSRKDGSKVASAVTPADGGYYFDITDEQSTNFIVSVSAEEYIGQEVEVYVPRNTVNQDFTLYSIWDGSPEEISKCGDYNGASAGFAAGASVMGAVKYSAEELKDYVGRSLSELSFYIASSSAAGVYVIVDFGNERALTKEVAAECGKWTSVNISGEDIRIPANTDVYFGYALSSPSDAKPLGCDDGPAVEGGGYTATYNAYKSKWSPVRNGNLLIKVSFAPSTSGLRAEGYSFIRVESDGDYVVVPGRGLKIVSTQWNNTGSIVQATVTYDDGTVEVIEMEL